MTNLVSILSESAGGSSSPGVLLYLIPIVVPVLISKLRKWIETNLGKAALPFAAIALGALCDVLLHLVTSGQFAGGEAGLFLGAAGIGLRELVDQVKKAIVQWWKEGLEDQG